MNRRIFMKLAGLSLASFTLPLSWQKPLRADALFETIFGDPRRAALVGLACQRQDRSAGARGQALTAELAAIPGHAREEHLRERALDDLSKLDIVVVDGWVMARSEADLCAAVHLDLRAAA